MAELGAAELGAAERVLVADYWWQRALGELTSWHGFQHVLADLKAEHAAPVVLELAGRAVQDEYRHAQFCREWAIRFGHSGGELLPRGERPIAFRGASEAHNRLLRIALCCINETVGCVVLRHVRPVVEWHELRELNRRHIACVLAPEPIYENCSAVCAQTFGGVRSTLCYLPPDATCDEQGVCTATSADVLRQDGILCGCADIGLK